MQIMNKNIIAVLLYAGQKGLTPPIKNIHGQDYGYAQVEFVHLDYPRLSEMLVSNSHCHSQMLGISYSMGSIIGFLSKYKVYDGDQNLSNWLVTPQNTAVDIDFDPLFTRFLRNAPDDIEYWLQINNVSGIQKLISSFWPQSAVEFFYRAHWHLNGQLPYDYSPKEYEKSYIQGFKDEFSRPPEWSFEDLWRGYMRKTENPLTSP